MPARPSADDLIRHWGLQEMQTERVWFTQTYADPKTSHRWRTRRLKSGWTGRVPLSGPSGSTITAAVPPRSAFFVISAPRASRSFG